MTYLDLRDLADERDALLDLATLSPGGGVVFADETDDAARFAALEALAADLGGDLRDIGENYEPTLIPEADFVDYARELAEDVFPFAPDSEAAKVLELWPYRCIDWGYAARELRHDYMSVTFDGDSYLIRSW